MRPAIEDAFDFLVELHSFQRSTSDDAVSYTVSYRSPLLVVMAYFNNRDGFDTQIQFLAHGSGTVWVGTILQATDASDSYDVGAQAAFLRAQLAKLVDLPMEVYEDLCALRFWHGPAWRARWGAAIKMNAASVAKERERLARVKGYFDAPEHN